MAQARLAAMAGESADMIKTCEIRIVPMRVADLDSVLKIETASFASPWSRLAFLSELLENDRAHYFVARLEDAVIGYIGTWIIFDEAHITNVAVSPGFRGRGVGRQLLTSMLEYCRSKGVVRATLEVRRSNAVAQNLYTSMNFVAAGVRKGYYKDNNEDAVVMWKELADGSSAD
jgi:ribosomal-protein-alanine N-acetyltransferase